MPKKSTSNEALRSEDLVWLLAFAGSLEAINQSTQKSREKIIRFAHKVDENRAAYYSYALLDGLSLSYTMFKYFCDVFIANQDFDAQHELMLSPGGMAAIAAESIFIIGFSFLACHFDGDKSNALKKFIAVAWPYTRDTLKALKNCYKGLRSTLQIAELLGAPNMLSTLIPAGLALGALAAANRIWMRSMVSKRKIQQDKNKKLLQDIEKLEALTYLEWQSYLKQIEHQSHGLRAAAFASAAFGGMADSMYLYVGILTLGSLSSTVLWPMTVLCVVYAVSCVITRIYEEHQYQQKLILSQVSCETALLRKRIETVYDEYLNNEGEELADLDKEQQLAKLSLVELEHQYSAIQQKLFIDELSQLETSVLEKIIRLKNECSEEELKKRLAEESLVLSAKKLRQLQDSQLNAVLEAKKENRLTVLKEPDVFELKKEEKLLQKLLLKKLFEEAEIKRSELQKFSTNSYKMAALMGMKHGLYAYGALASVMFVVATVLFLCSVSFPPALLAAGVVMGAVFLLGFVAHSLLSNYWHNHQQKQKLKDSSEAGKLNELKEEIDKTDKNLLPQQQFSDSLRQGLIMDPSPQFFFQEWFEVIRSFFSGLGKGQRNVDFTCNPLLEADENGHYHETPIMFGIMVVSSIVFSFTLALRALAKGFRGKGSEKEETLSSGEQEPEKRNSVTGPKIQEDTPFYSSEPIPIPQSFRPSSHQESTLSPSPSLQENSPSPRQPRRSTNSLSFFAPPKDKYPPLLKRSKSCSHLSQYQSADVRNSVFNV